MAANSAPVSLYIHVPFCRFKCFYCDFNTYAGIEKLIPEFVTALCAEIARWGEALQISEIETHTPTIFFGGGTPSLLTPGQIESILAAVSDSFTLADDAEISMEVNPESVTRPFIRAVLSLGVNRFSMGAQSFDASELQMLGRLHDVSGIERAFTDLRGGGATNVNLDLMYALPRQTMQTWEASIDGALALEPEHLSLYALTVEESTPFHGWVESGRLPAPDADMAADMYEAADERMARAGMGHYEISNWARAGRECRHNLAYWLNTHFLGFGPGAHSHLFGARFSVMRQPRAYITTMDALSRQSITTDHSLPSLEAVTNDDNLFRRIAPIDSIDPYTQDMRRAETLVLGLRLNRGVSEDDYAERFGVHPSSLYGNAITESIEDGLLERADGVLRLTPRGRLLSNEVFVRIMANL